MRVIVGVSGGIAAYKACEVIRRFKELGHSVRVIPTPSALKFVGAATFEALSGELRRLRTPFPVSLKEAPTIFLPRRC